MIPEGHSTLSKRITKGNSIIESEADTIERKLGPNGRGLQPWKSYRDTGIAHIKCFLTKPIGVIDTRALPVVI